MKSLNRLLFFILIFEVSLLFLQSSSALFSDTAASTNNTFTASLEFPILITPTPPENIANHIVISEIQINGANANQDFVELYNPKNTSEDLSGWQINKKTSTGTASSL